MYAFEPRWSIRKRDGQWWLNLGYGTTQLPHDTWVHAVRHARFIYRIYHEDN